MLDSREIAAEIARLEYEESSYPNYAKLANLYTIRDQMEREIDHRTDSSPEIKTAAFAAAPIDSYGNSDFLQAVAGKDPASVWDILDDLMDTLEVANPRVYASVMRKLNSI